VPWNKAANKYMCPCHGSQYDQTGKVRIGGVALSFHRNCDAEPQVIRGPAPLSLAIAHITDADGAIIFSTW
jgi:cytochrome b6-f complex iron-sulfur subunit